MNKILYILIILFSINNFCQNVVDKNNFKQGLWILTQNKNSIKINLKDNKILGKMYFFKNENLALECFEESENIFRWKLFINDSIVEGYAKYNEESLFRYYDLKFNPLNPKFNLKLSELGDFYPSYKGSESELKEYLINNLTSQNIKNAKFKVDFVINENGKIIDVKVSSSTNLELNKLIIKIFENMPNWNPGFQRFKFVKVRMSIPIST